MEQIGAAVLGTGWVASEHVAAYQQNARARVVALLSRERARGEAAARRFGLEGCRVYTNLDALLRDDDVRVVSICTPNDLHARQAIACAEAGRHVLIEKPMALTFDDARAVERAVRKAGVRSLVGFVLRWNPMFRNIRRMIDDGLLGKLYLAEVGYLSAIEAGDPASDWTVRRSSAGTNLLTAGCHAVDAVRWFVRNDVVEVFAYGNRSPANRLQLEFEPNSVTLMRFADGTIGTVVCTLESPAPYMLPVMLVGDRGSVRNNQVFTTAWPGQTDWATVPTVLPDSVDVTHHPFAAEIDHLLTCIAEGQEPSCGASDALLTHEVVFASDLSATARQPVALPLR